MITWSLFYCIFRRRFFRLPAKNSAGDFYLCQPGRIWAVFALADWLGLARGGWLRLLLGEVFSWQDILMYALGSLSAWALHRYVFAGSQQVPESRE